MQILYSHGAIAAEEVIQFLVLSGLSDGIFAEMIKCKEAVKAANELQLVVSDIQLQKRSDAFRVSRGLYDAQDMLTFLKRNGLTQDDFEVFCETSLLTTALADRLADEKRIEHYFVLNRSSFDAARISIILVRERELANEIAIQAREEEGDFHALARKYSLHEPTRYSGGYAGLVSRRDLPTDAASQVFHASAGDVLGPFQSDGLFQVILVEEVVKPTLDGVIRSTIKEKILQEWLSTYLQGGFTVAT